LKQKPCYSRDWWPEIEKTAEEFEKILNKKGNRNSVFFQYRLEKLDRAFKMYEDAWRRFKEDVYEDPDEEIIDRHKITAIYILSFLIARPFDISAGKETEDISKRPLFWANELFSLEVMLTLIRLWHEDDGIFDIDENEKKWFIILLNHIKLEMIKLNLHSISVADPSIVADILSLAQIIYHIEKPYITT
jgi:hypothetical protein